MVTIAEFNGWLQKGLGRAVVYLREHDPQPYRAAVLHACTHALTHDSQCEGSREEYLLDLIHTAGNEQFFRNGLLAALTTEPEDPGKYDLGQTIELARLFAQKGDSEIKQAMYDAVARAGFAREGYCCADLVMLDGIDALLFAADLFPAAIDDDDLWQVNVLITALEDRDGTESATETIQRVSRERSSLARMLEMARASKAALKQKVLEPLSRTRPDYLTLKRMITEHGVKSYLFAWSRTASTEELEAVADDLIGEMDEGRLLAYLSIFRDRQFPHPVGGLIELVQHGSIRIARHAIRALSQLKDPAIRSLALTLLGAPGRAGDGVDLLASNYQTGDFQMIEALLREPMDVDDLHHFGMGVRHLLEVHCPKEAEHSLLLLYENGPCSLCRGEFVEHLIALQRLPDWMRSECRFDASTEIRKLVQ